MTLLLFGSTESDLEIVKGEVESILSMRLASHESSYHGGNYYRLEVAGIYLILQKNFDLLDDDLAEPDFPDSRALLYLEGNEEANKIAARLLGSGSSFALLK